MDTNFGAAKYGHTPALAAAPQKTEKGQQFKVKAHLQHTAKQVWQADVQL